MTSSDAIKLVDFVNTSFSTSIVSAFGKQGKVKRKANHRKHIEKNRQKTDRKSTASNKAAAAAVGANKPVRGGKSQSQRLQQFYNSHYHQQQQQLRGQSLLPAEGTQCLPLWPCMDNGYTIMPSARSELFQSPLVPASCYQHQQQSGLPMTQSTLDLDIESLLRGTADPMAPSSRCVSAPYETTVDYPECYSDHSRPLSPYIKERELSSEISDKEFEDLLIDQLQSSPGSSDYSSSPMASCVPSPAIRAYESQILPTPTYAVYDSNMLYH